MQAIFLGAGKRVTRPLDLWGGCVAQTMASKYYMAESSRGHGNNASRVRPVGNALGDASATAKVLLLVLLLRVV